MSKEHPEPTTTSGRAKWQPMGMRSYGHAGPSESPRQEAPSVWAGKSRARGLGSGQENYDGTADDQGPAANVVSQAAERPAAQNQA